MYSTGLLLNLHKIHLFVAYLLVVIASCQTQIKLLQFTSSCIEFTFLVLLLRFFRRMFNLFVFPFTGNLPNYKQSLQMHIY